LPGDLWATVNACDSPRFPDRVGVRAAMPGDRTGKRMYARFRLQYHSALRGGWKPVANGQSPKLFLGSARRDRQAGWTFRVNPPARGGSFRCAALPTSSGGSGARGPLFATGARYAAG